MKKVILLSLVMIGLLGVMQFMYADTTQSAALTTRITEIRTLRIQRDQELNDLLAQIQTMLTKLSSPNAKTSMKVKDYDRAMKALEGALKIIFVNVGPASLKELAPAKANAMEAWSLIVNTPELIGR
ncbi:MAG: hypothetical protein WC365_05885 [Candidatus Babeliales bacterium]|jgi:hypothetical protein